MANDIKRVDFNFDKSSCDGGSIDECAKGDYVLYEDHIRIVAELKARCERLNEECARLAMEKLNIAPRFFSYDWSGNQY